MRLLFYQTQSNIFILYVRYGRQLNVSKFRGCPQHSEAVENILSQDILILCRNRHGILVHVRHGRQLNASKFRGRPQHSEATHKLYSNLNINNFIRVDTYIKHTVQQREKVRPKRQEKNKNERECENTVNAFKILKKKNSKRENKHERLVGFIIDNTQANTGFTLSLIHI